MSDEKVDLLIPLRALLSQPECWIKGSYAQSADKQTQPWDGAHATCWCLEGAVLRVYGKRALSPPNVRGTSSAIFVELRGRIDGDSLPRWNDAPGRTFADVQALLKEPFYG